MAKHKQTFSRHILEIQDVVGTVEQIVGKLREDVNSRLQRNGAVVGISGGIDSSVTFALAVRAFGPESVLGIKLPEQDSSPDSLSLADQLVDKYGARTITEDMTSALKGFKCYSRRDEAVSTVFPDYDPKIHRFKIGIRQSSLKQNMPPVFSVTLVYPDGEEKSKLLPAKAYLQIVAASNFKQRSRMSMLYYHAERMHYAVVGTPNKHEVEQGFFVKFGDGGADVMPIAQLYKTQVYQLAEFLEIPRGIIARTPTTDTYTAEQTQEEFFYQLPFDLMDLFWYGWENGYSAGEVGSVMAFTEKEVENVYKSFERKRKTTEYLRTTPIF